MNYVWSTTDGWMMLTILSDIARRPPTWNQVYELFPNVPHEHIQRLVRLGISEGVLREVIDANGKRRIDWKKIKQKPEAL